MLASMCCLSSLLYYYFNDCVIVEMLSVSFPQNNKERIWVCVWGNCLLHVACPRVGRWMDWGHALGVWASRQDAAGCAACVPCWDLWAVRVPIVSTSQTPLLKRKSMNWDEDCCWPVASVSVHRFWFWDLRPVMSFLLPYICWSLKAAALMGRFICLCLNILFKDWFKRSVLKF